MRSSGLDGHRGRLAAAACLLLSWIGFFWHQIFSTEFPYYRDNLLTNVPLRHYIHACLRSGRLPQWFPFESLGVPLIGQIATGLFHPATWVLLPLPELMALKWNLLLAYLIASWGAYLLARYFKATRLASLTAALSFAFGGYLLGVSSAIFYLMGTATLPWVAWAAHRVARQARLKDCAVLAVVGSLMFYAADVQDLFLCVLFVPVTLAIEGVRLRALVLFVVAGVLAGLLCGLELVPALHISADSIRVQGAPSATLGLTWSLHPWRLPELLVPGYIPDVIRSRVTSELFNDGSSVFATTLFAGGCALTLAALGLTTRSRIAAVYGTLAVLGIWLALGDHGGFLPLIKSVVPLLQRFRYPVKYISVFWLGLIPLVAVGTDVFRRHPRRAVVALTITWVVAGIASSLIASHGLAASVWRLAGSAIMPDDPTQALLDDAWGTGLLYTAGFAGLAALVAFASRRRSEAILAVPLIVFLELWHGNAAHLPTLPSSILAEPNPFANAIIASTLAPRPPPRVARDVDVNVGLTVTGIDNGQWVEANLLALKPDLSAYYGIASLGENLGATTVRHGLLFGPKARWALRYSSFFDGCFLVTESGRALRDGERSVAMAPLFGWALVEQPCWPRAFLARTYSLPDLSSALKAMKPEELSQVAVSWEGGPPIELARGTVRWLRYEPEHLEVEVETDRVGALVVTDAFAPGWKATLDGQPTSIYPTLVVARGVVVPQGRHRVEMTYRTPGLGLGLGLTISGLIVTLTLLFWGKRGPRTPDTQRTANSSFVT